MVALWTAHAQLTMLILCHVVVANQALHEDTKVRGPGVEATKNIPLDVLRDLLNSA